MARWKAQQASYAVARTWKFCHERGQTPRFKASLHLYWDNMFCARLDQCPHSHESRQDAEECRHALVAPAKAALGGAMEVDLEALGLAGEYVPEPFGPR